ncbi:MAG: hypothetical protein L0312_15850, partial [Acidobacteria bacterium]|nr:hypothetical protein [Acidobacteriota bacterium]
KPCTVRPAFAVKTVVSGHWIARVTRCTVQDHPRPLFHGFDAKTPLGERWRRLAQTKLRELDDLQRSVSRMRSAIKIGLACGCLDIENCTLARSRNRETGQPRKPSSNRRADRSFTGR